MLSLLVRKCVDYDNIWCCSWWVNFWRRSALVQHLSSITRRSWVHSPSGRSSMSTILYIISCYKIVSCYFPTLSESECCDFIFEISFWGFGASFAASCYKVNWRSKCKIQLVTGSVSGQLLKCFITVHSVHWHCWLGESNGKTRLNTPLYQEDNRLTQVHLKNAC